MAAVKQYLKSDSAKICGYDIEENIPQKTHESVMKGEIDTLFKLRESKDQEFFNNIDIIKNKNRYYYIFQVVENTNQSKINFILNSIIIE